ncbi:restriction endonuclease subunit S [Flavobacterium sp. LS1R10]|uniref:restriction endonuclease subunit S n=1 Tax=Flavobacterium sp. LS1R10 TaxID=2497482 RepID=UPI000F84E263|nr:restriction endonuclease subunit S [Flavobacterium sp. LS1R10]RTY75148.1 restriction endonuclease subunit S [Flavobacterium sp. LS1R10]
MSTATLNSEKKKALVPELRFFGFEDEWKEKKIGKVFKINAGGDIDNERVSFEKTEKFKYPIYANAKKDKGFYGYSDIYKIESGTITVAGRGVYIGIAHARDHQYYPIVRLLVLKPLANEDIYFSENVINRLNLFVESTGVPQLTAPQFSNYKISLPSLPEQQKIASFLSAVDEKLQQLSRKKELLEQYKKGVMQQLFSGKLRFKDENGEDYLDWEEKKLGEVATKKSSNISANKIEENFGAFIIYGASGVLKKVDFYKEENDYVSIVKDGAGVGRLLYCKGKSSVLGTMEIISPKLRIDTYFLYCLLSNIDFVKYVTGSTIPHIYFKDYSNEICGIPTLSEQKKIADFLSSIDAKIESTAQQITQTQSFKKGLLQQLFV